VDDVLMQRFRGSGSFYLSTLMVGILLSRFANYLWFEIPVFKGQAANILVFFVVFGVALALWLLLKRDDRASGPLTIYLILMSLAWVATLAVYRYHGDSFNYIALLYIPVLFLLWGKPPTADEGWRSILNFAWVTAGIIVLTRALEITSVISVKYQTPNLIRFDEEGYFLPLNDLLGIDGRWPGPFGHNGDTAMMGSLLIVIALIRWSRGSWVFLLVGGFTLLVTSGRASIGAVLAAIVIFCMLTRTGWPTRWSFTLRRILGGVLLALGAIGLLGFQYGLTGRQTIWPAFIELWQTSPIIGVGGSGIAVSGGLTQEFLHAHSHYIDILARNGILVFLIQFAALGFGLFVALKVGFKGKPAALALLVVFFVAGITEPRNDWIAPSVTGMLVIVASVIAFRERPAEISEVASRSRSSQ